MFKKKKNRSYIDSNTLNPTHFSFGQLKIYAYLLPIAIVMLLPIIFIFVDALKPLDELFAYPPRFYVKNPTLQNFKNLFNATSTSNIPASRYLFNTLISTSAVMLGTIALSVVTGYVLSKKRFKYRELLFTINTVALMFVPIAVQIPRYFIIVFLGLKNSFWSNIIPLLISPTCVFLVKQFIDQLPDALIEAAVIDGANDWVIIKKIIVPLVKPTIATVAIVTFQIAWGSTEASTLYLDGEANRTFMYYISTITSASAIDGRGMSAAASLIMFLPNLIFFIAMQSRVMNTMVNSGIK